jgi:hypothetical protein
LVAALSLRALLSLALPGVVVGSRLPVIELDWRHVACVVGLQQTRKGNEHRDRPDHGDDDQHAGKAHGVNDRRAA